VTALTERPEAPAAPPQVPVVRDRAALGAARASLGSARVAVVMTMGALHAGHAALLREARLHADAVIVTVFVNPLQFGDAADLERYPRTLAADLEVCAQEGADVVFAPPYSEVYPAGPPAVRVSGGELGQRLEGASRPGHFDGVLTVVAKLLAMTRPDVAVFGEKDAQQLALVRRMVADLDLGVEIVGVATVRDPDGMALSSRNARLSPQERRRALALSRALRAGVAAAPAGAESVLAAARGVLDGAEGVSTDYLALVGELFDEPRPGAPVRLVAAARVGQTRLIDNEPLVLPRSTGKA
jgi:pantoate--beta-alanine ligase